MASSIDVSRWDGTLSSRDFCVAVEGYLLLENVILPKFFCEEHQEVEVSHSQTPKEEPTCSHQDNPVDTAILVERYGSELHHYDFHILYSASYLVPVLYFRAYLSDGRPLVLDDFEKDLPANSVKALAESKWTFITQEVAVRPITVLQAMVALKVVG